MARKSGTALVFDFICTCISSVETCYSCNQNTFKYLQRCWAYVEVGDEIPDEVHLTHEVVGTLACG